MLPAMVVAAYWGGATLSDIQIHFDWYVFPLLAVMIGWPGLLLGLAVGGFAWRRHRVIGALLGAVTGTAVWATSLIMWG
jgi:hypothetical protein